MLAIAYLREDQIELSDLEKYLQDQFNKDWDILKNNKASFRTNLRRLIRMYDYLKGKK